MGVILAFLSALLFAINNVLVKKGMKFSKSKKENGVLISFLINVIILGFFFIIYRLLFKPQIEFNWLGIILFILAGCLTTFIGRTTFFIGIRRIGPSKAAAIKNSAPIFTVIFAVIILNEIVYLGSWIGIVLILTGILIQGYNMFRKNRQIELYGFIFAVVAAISFGVGQGVRKQGLIFLNDPFAGALIGVVVALISYLLMLVIQKKFIDTMKSNFSQRNIYYYLGGIATSFATLSFFVGIWFTKVAYVGTIIAAEPILTVIISKVFLRDEEKLTPFIITAAIFVFIGAAIIAVTS